MDLTLLTTDKLSYLRVLQTGHIGYLLLSRPTGELCRILSRVYTLHVGLPGVFRAGKSHWSQVLFTTKYLFALSFFSYYFY